MMAAMRLRNCATIVLHSALVMMLAGCAYRLPPFTPASQELIHIVAGTPEQYTGQVNTGGVRDYDVPHDGRSKIGIPPYRRSCGVYLFDVIKVGGDADPLKSWVVAVVHSGKTVRKQSLLVTRKFPTDDAGYHIVKITR
jgi:hypothetical protein